jgi:retron-type reverse transcriptase
MKRYGNLYNKVWDLDNIREAHKNSRKGKAHYHEVKMVEANPEFYFKQIQDMLRRKTYQTSEYTMFIKNDKGKEREIYKLPYFPDRIVHHCIMQVVEPIWMKTFIRDTYASMKNRGIHDGVKRIQKALRESPADTKYALQIDIKKFYPSIDHTILKQIIRKKIKDKDILWIIDEIIDSNSNGVPIGNYLSQFFGNLYLSDIDHWIKEDLGIKHYYRYCDDLVILGDNKEELHAIRKQLKVKVEDVKLQIKCNWKVYPVNIGIDFLGYKFFHTHTLLRTSLAKRFKSKVKMIRKNWHRLDAITNYSTLMSYYGWQKYANAWNLYTQTITFEIRDRMNWITTTVNNPLKGIL